MHPRGRPFLVLVLLASCPLTAEAPAGPAAAALVARMTDATAAWEERCRAEDSLSELPPQEVLPALLPHVEREMPSPGIWNSAGREIDRKAPVNWQIWYAVARAWDHQLASPATGAVNRELRKLLGEAKGARAKTRILQGLTHRWTPDLEAPVAALLEAPSEDLMVKTTAALALILHGARDYQDLLVGFAQASGFADRRRWLDLLADPRHARRTGVDPRVVRMGFDLIVEARKSSPGDDYFLAIKVGQYIGLDFTPDSKAPRYRGERGLSEAFFADTVKKAVDWWTANRAGVERGSAGGTRP